MQGVQRHQEALCGAATLCPDRLVHARSLRLTPRQERRHVPQEQRNALRRRPLRQALHCGQGAAGIPPTWNPNCAIESTIFSSPVTSRSMTPKGITRVLPPPSPTSMMTAHPLVRF